MCIKIYNQLASRLQLYQLLQEGIDDVAVGRTQPLEEAMEEIRKQRKWVK